MFDILFSSEAEADFRDSYDYYEMQQDGLGERFEQAIYSCLLKTAEHPGYYGSIEIGLRKVLVPDFPFIIAFEADFDAGKLYVVSVAHTSRSMDERYKKR